MINIRASSLGEIFDCPARWEAKNLLNIRHPSNGKAQLGTAIHAGTAAYDQAALDGSPITVDAAAGELVSVLHSTDYEVDWSEDSPKDAEKVGLILLTKYCAEIAPLQDYVGVEVKCEQLEITDLGISLSGTTDRIRRVGDELGISDLKSGGRAVGSDGKAVTAGHGAQLAVYELLAETQSGNPLTLPAQIVGLQTAKTTARVGFGEIPNVRAALIGTEDEPGLLHHAAGIIHSGRFYGNPKSMLCSPKFCPKHPTCKFKN